MAGYLEIGVGSKWQKLDFLELSEDGLGSQHKPVARLSSSQEAGREGSRMFGPNSSLCVTDFIRSPGP